MASAQNPYHQIQFLAGATIDGEWKTSSDSIGLDTPTEWNDKAALFASLTHIQNGETPLAVNIWGDTVQTVTTNFARLEVETENPFAFPLHLRMKSRPRSPLDRNNGHPRVLRSFESNHLDEAEAEGPDGRLTYEGLSTTEVDDSVYNWDDFYFRDENNRMLESWGGTVEFELVYQVKEGGVTREKALDGFTVEVIRPLVILLNWDGVPRTLPEGNSGIITDWFKTLVHGTVQRPTMFVAPLMS